MDSSHDNEIPNPNPCQVFAHRRALPLLLQQGVSGGGHRSVLVGEQSVPPNPFADHTERALFHLDRGAQLLVLPLLREGVQQILAGLRREVPDQGRVSAIPYQLSRILFSFIAKSLANLNSPYSYSYLYIIVDTHSDPWTMYSLCLV